MSRVMLDTIKQLYNLIWFCKKVSIPFEVYAFTNEWKKPEVNYETCLLYTSPSPRDLSTSRMPSSA